MALFCGRCGGENPPVARHCGECGQLLEEHEAGPVASEVARQATGDPGGIRCVRCGSRIGELERCPTCRTLQPMHDGQADPWLHWLLFRIPDFLRSPRQLAAELPYRQDLTGLLSPLLASMLLMPWAWWVALSPTLLPAWRATRLPQPEAGGVAALLAALALLGPCLLLGYAALMQGVAAMFGGLGSLEKTMRALALVYLPGLLAIGGWICLMRVSQLLLLDIGWLSSDFAVAPIPAVYLYALIPLLCLYAAFGTLLGLVAYQAIVVAEINRLPVIPTMMAHAMLIVLLIGIATWNHTWRPPSPPRTPLAAIALSPAGGSACLPWVV